MAETPGNISGEDNLIVPEDYTLNPNEVAFPNSQILLPENTSGLNVTIQKTDNYTGILTISIPVQFLKAEGDLLGEFEIGVRTAENIVSTVRSDGSRFRVAWDPVNRTFVEVTIPISAFKKFSSN